MEQKTGVLVLAIGEFGKQVAENLIDLVYGRSLSTRDLFRVLVFLPKGKKHLYIEHWPADENSNRRAEKVKSFVSEGRKPSTSRETDDSDLSAQEILSLFLHNAESVSARINEQLHYLRSHSALINVGQTRFSLLIHILLIADLSSPAGAGGTIPMGVILQHLCDTDHYIRGTLLLNIGVPPGTDAQVERLARAYVSLHTLDMAWDPEQYQVFANIAKKMGTKLEGPFTLEPFLFDYRKKGTTEAEDVDEIRLIIANWAAALTLGVFSSRTFQWEHVYTARGFYGTAGATAIVYNPTRLVDACATRLAHTIAKDVFSPTAEPSHIAVRDLADTLTNKLLPYEEWFKNLIPMGDDYLTIQGNDEPEVHLLFGAFEFSKIPRERWAEAIENYDALFARDPSKMPRYLSHIEEASARLREETLNQLSKLVDKAITDDALYPGGIRTILEALDLFAGRIESAQRRLEEHKRTLSAQVEEKIEELEQEAWNLPSPLTVGVRALLLAGLFFYLSSSVGHILTTVHPIAKVIGWIVGLVGAFAIAGAFALWLYRKERYLIELREHCVKLVEEKHAINLENAMREKLKTMCDALKERVEDEKKAVENLGKKMASIPEHLPRLFQQDSSPFRLYLVTEDLVAWAYKSAQPDAKEIGRHLVSKQDLLREWRTIEPADLARRISSGVRDTFSFVYKETLQQVLLRQAGEDALPTLLVQMAERSIPLLRYSFDHLGGVASGVIASVRTTLFRSHIDTVLSRIVKEHLNNWDIEAISHPNIMCFCQVDQGIPLAALMEFNRAGEHALNKLDDSARKKIELGITPPERKPSRKRKGREHQ